jgi:hypothetical protein
MRQMAGDCDVFLEASTISWKDIAAAMLMSAGLWVAIIGACNAIV